MRITDDDSPGVSVQPPALTIDEGQSESYSVVLNSVPAGIVTVVASLTAGAGAVTVAPKSLTFSATDWDTAQQVTVTAVADTDGDDAHAAVGHTVSGADYGSVRAAPVAVTVRDDETASSGIELVPDPTSVAESGGERIITVTARLDAAPRAAATAVQGRDRGRHGDTRRGLRGGRGPSRSRSPREWSAARPPSRCRR